MTYSAPERATERQMAKRLRAKVLRAGGCAYCLNRIEGWGLTACGIDTTFPRCMQQDKFQLDHDKLKGI